MSNFLYNKTDDSILNFTTIPLPVYMNSDHLPYLHIQFNNCEIGARHHKLIKSYVKNCEIGMRYHKFIAL